MRHRQLLFLLGVSLIASSLAGQPRQGTPAADSIRHLEEAWSVAFCTSDFAFMERVLAPEFTLVGIRSTGVSTVTRSEWLANTRVMTFRAFDARVLSVETYGDAAVVTMDGSWTIDWNGRHIDEKFLVTDVWVLRNTKWQVVRRHSSPYPK